MTLQSLSTFPSTRCYVLKLHRDAAPDQGRLIGRLEHITSSEHVDFTNAEQLLAWLALHAANVASDEISSSDDKSQPA